MGADRKRASVGPCLVTRDLPAPIEADGLQRREARKPLDVTCNQNGVNQ